MSDFSSYGLVSKDWEEVAKTLPTPAFGNLSWEERREAVNKHRGVAVVKAMLELADKVDMKDYSITTRDGETIEARTYKTAGLTSDEPLPLYIHFHGGGFLYGNLENSDAACSRIALGTNVLVLNVNYRYTPAWVYPTAWNDSEDTLRWVHENSEKLGVNPKQIVLGGISAGGHLSASLTLEQHLGRAAVGLPPIAGQILMIPWLVHQDCYDVQRNKLKDPSLSSYVQNEFAPILPIKAANDFMTLLKFGELQPDDTKVSPGNATPEQVKGLPPTVLGIAGLDPLRDEGLFFGRLLAEAGVPTDVHVFKGLPHGFRTSAPGIPDSARWDKVMVDGILWALSGPKTSLEFTVNE